MRFCRIALIFLCGIVFLGCDAYEEDPYEISDKAPVISIEKIGENLTETQIEVSFKAVADSGPKTDLLVMMIFYGSRYTIYTYTQGTLYTSKSSSAIIPKGKKESIVLSESINLYDYCGVRIIPVPTVTIVGKGEVIDQQKLQKQWGGKSTMDDQRIPEDYIFPYYQVNETSELLLHHPGKAKIIKVDPPDGSTLEDSTDEIIIRFDVAPEHLNVTGEHITFTSAYYAPTIFSIHTFIYASVPGVAMPYFFTIEWGEKSEGTYGSQSFIYYLSSP